MIFDLKVNVIPEKDCFDKDTLIAEIISVSTDELREMYSDEDIYKFKKHVLKKFDSVVKNVFYNEIHNLLKKGLRDEIKDLVTKIIKNDFKCFYKRIVEGELSDYMKYNIKRHERTGEFIVYPGQSKLLDDNDIYKLVNEFCFEFIKSKLIG